MKVEKLSAILGTVVMLLTIVFVDRESETFLRFFGVGLGLTLTWVVSSLISAIIYFFSFLKK